jgi:peptidoglycan/xylan/chitin deacetylase (PgdA/CDA1 family)
MAQLLTRAINKGRRLAASKLQRRLLTLDGRKPLVSFSFDDAPVSAFELGAPLLEAHGARATYYVSLGLMGMRSELGPIGDAAHVRRAHADGHELGCHTHDHLDAWHCSVGDYIASIDRNREALATLLPEASMRSFAYPKSGAYVAVKSPLQRRFMCCRGGGQTLNSGTIDLNLLSAVFIDRRAGIGLDDVRALIRRNAEQCGWLIFAAHDLSDSDGAFSCSPAFFAEVLREVVVSGADILPVAEACDRLMSPRPTAA